MAAVWHFILSILVSLGLINPTMIVVAEPSAPEPIYQEFGDAPEIAGITSGLPEAEVFPEPSRLDSWNPPNTEDITAESIMIMDKYTGQVLWSRSPEKVWPLASITKLVATMVVLEEVGSNSDFWDEFYVMSASDATDGTVYIYQGETVQVEDLFNFSLVGSINSATRALVHAAGFTDEEAVVAMNAFARSKGFWNTHFSDVTGLSAGNVTTAKEAAWIIKEALTYPKIQQTLLKDSYTLTTDRERTISVRNTNELLHSDLIVEGGKTGFITESGYNFAASLSDGKGSVVVVVLGTDGKELRFSETEAMANWAFENYRWE